VEEMCRKSMSESMRGQWLANTGFLGVTLDDVPEGLARHAVAAPCREKIVSLALPQDIRSSALEIAFQPPLRFLTERDQPFATAFAGNPHDALTQVDLVQLQLYELGNTQARR